MRAPVLQAVLLLMLVGLLPAARPAAAQSPEPGGGDRAADVLERASERYQDIHALCATFEQERIVPLLNQTTRARGTLCQMDPGYFLMDFSEPDGDRIVADGQVLWIYYPSMDDDQVIRTRLGAPGTTFDFHREFLDRPTTRFDASYEGRETVDGVETDVVALRPRERAGYEVARVWLEADRGLIRKVEIEEENESIRRVVLTDIDVDPELSTGRFHFEPPEGARILDQSPSALPR